MADHTEWDNTPKQVPVDPEGVPRFSLLAGLAERPDSGIVQIEPGRYLTAEPSPGPQG